MGAKKAQKKQDVVSAMMIEAFEEVEDAQIREYKRQIKVKIKELKAAEKVAANVKREIEDLELRIRDELGA